MIMCHTANSHFALLLQPGLTSQCISSIMQRCWDPFHSVPQNVTRTQRSLSMIPRQALQGAWFHSETTDPAQTLTPACLDPRLLSAVRHGGWITTHPGFIWSYHFWVNSSDTQSRRGSAQLFPKHGQRGSQGGVEGSSWGGGGWEDGKALLGSAVVQGTTG